MQVAQLDPSSLSLWLSLGSVFNSPNARAYQTIIDSALGGATARQNILPAVEQLPPASVGRGVQLASTIWHEKRHFLDLLVTNYGALRLRQFYLVYVNMFTLGAIAVDEGVALPCPLSVYDDPVKWQVLGWPDVHEFRTVGEELAERDRWLADERMRIESPLGQIEVGGEAQLEALAYLCQQSVAAARLSPKHAIVAERDLRERFGRPDLRYQWLHQIALLMGITRGTRVPGGIESGDPVMVMGVTVLGPMLLASLMSRHHGQGQVSASTHASNRPSNRLAGLIQAFAGKAEDMSNWDAADAWTKVNEVCTDLWGRSVLDEMEHDLREEADMIASFRESYVVEEVVHFIQDIHECRQRLYLLMQENAEVFSDVLLFGNIVDLLDPLMVQVAPHGELGKPPDGWTQLFGYRDEDFVDEGRWWWAIAWPEALPQAVVRLGDRANNIQVASRFAPLAKLLLNGRSHRTMIGAELVSAELDMQEALSLTVDPYYSEPRPLVESPALLAFLMERDQIVCDYCHQSVHADASGLVSPWFFRRPEPGSKIIERAGGGALGELRLIRDWSEWLLCAGCLDGAGLAPQLADST